MTMLFDDLASRCAPGVEASTLAALIRHESNFARYAVHVNGPYRLTRQPSDLSEATRTAAALIAAGRSVDLGLGQINSRNLIRLRLTVAMAFDPCHNLRAIETVLLHWCYQPAVIRFGSGPHALEAALDCYHGSAPAAFPKTSTYVAALYQAATMNRRAGVPILVDSADPEKQP